MKNKSKEKPYDPEFVEKIIQGRKDIKDGKGIKININDLWNIDPIPLKKTNTHQN